MPAWEILKTIWGQLSVTTYYMELCQDNVEKRPQRQWSLRRKCQSIGSCAIQSYTVSAVLNSLRALKKTFCYVSANNLTGNSLWSVLETYNYKWAKLFLATCISKIRCQVFLYMCYKLYHIENRSLLWQELSENRLCLYLSSSDDMQKQLSLYRLGLLFSQTVRKEYEEKPDCTTNCNIFSTVSTVKRLLTKESLLTKEPLIHFQIFNIYP